MNGDVLNTCYEQFTRQRNVKISGAKSGEQTLVVHGPESDLLGKGGLIGASLGFQRNTPDADIDWRRCFR